MIISAIQYSSNKNQRNDSVVKPVQLTKQSGKDGVAENSYQSLLQQAMMVYQR